LVVLCCGTITLAQTTQPAEKQFAPQGYELVFADEFSDPKLDTNRWFTRYIYNDGKLDTLNDERQLFREDKNHVMSGSTLELTAYHQPDLRPPRFLYRSGMVRSKMTFKYGYFEARCKMPRGLGVWPAFWLNSDKRESDGKLGWPPEIDILEFAFNGKDDKANMIHVAVHSKKNDKTGENAWKPESVFAHADMKKNHYQAPFDFRDDYHVFGCLWDTDDTVAIFVDGVMIKKWKYKWVYGDGSDAGYAHVLLNLSIGGQWAGRYGIDNDAFPQSFSVDYVRVYQKPEEKKTGISTVGHDLLDKPTTQPSTQPAL
jgi:beta-glucanase (GH16 family)